MTRINRWLLTVLVAALLTLSFAGVASADPGDLGFSTVTSADPGDLGFSTAAPGDNGWGGW